MLAKEVIELADELAPNVFSTEVKLFELNRLEQRIRVDILLENPNDVAPITADDLTAATEQTDMTTLTVGDGESSTNPGGDAIIDDPQPDDPISDNPAEPFTPGGNDPGNGNPADPVTPGGNDPGNGEQEDDATNSGSGADAEDTPTPGTLALEERYRDVYLFWMISMYYYHMGEYEEYQNKKIMFETAWQRFVRDVCDAFHVGTGGPEYDP